MRDLCNRAVQVDTSHIKLAFFTVSRMIF